jgi:tRNA G10  N-methylase Trm11
VAHPTRKGPPSGKDRRAFSTVRAPGRIERGGDAALSGKLAAALEQAREHHEVAESLTHPLHAYPARMHPATARALVHIALASATARQAGELPLGPLVLDPYCGSGTVLVEGRYAGARTVGVDANPVAVLISRAKTWTVPAERRSQLREYGYRIAAATLNEGRAARRAGYEQPGLRSPRGMDPRIRNRRLVHWFPPHTRRELEHMAGQIDDVRQDDSELADMLTVALSAVLYKVSRRASDTDPSRVERRIGRGAAARLFRGRVDLLVAGLDDLASASDAPPAAVYRGDARNLRRMGLHKGSVDAVITSPPYAGTYDYAEQHRLRLDFLGLSSQAFRRSEMGSRRQFTGPGSARRRARRRFTRALAGSFREMARVLKPGNVAAVIYGDSVAGERPAWADEVLSAAIGDAFEMVAWAWQERHKLDERERMAFGERPKREGVFLLRRNPIWEPPSNALPDDDDDGDDDGDDGDAYPGDEDRDEDGGEGMGNPGPDV